MINIALIGVGSMGRNHYRILKQFSGRVNICGLCDTTKLNNFEEPVYTDVNTLLHETKPDAAFIMTPTSSHKDIALMCVEHNAHLFIEKPAASTAEDARLIKAAIEARDLKCCVGYVERFNPVVQTLIDELHNKEIYSISITRVGPFPPRVAEVGVLTDLSVHDIDLIHFITRSKIVKKSIFKSRKIHNEHEDIAVLSFELEDTSLAEITTNWLTPFKKRTIEVACKEAYYEADLMSQILKVYSGFNEDNSYIVRDCHIKKDEPLLKEVEEFISYLEDGRERKHLASIEDSILTLEIASDRGLC